MKLFAFILILACFMQSAFLPINLVLILLISRSLIVSERSNLILGFSAGVLLGLLNSINIGFYALFFILAVEITHLVKRSPFSANVLTVVPLTFVFMTLLSLCEQLFFGSTFHLSLVLGESLLSLPVFFLIKIWEERFVVAPPLKLKV